MLGFMRKFPFLHVGLKIILLQNDFDSFVVAYFNVDICQG